MKHPLNSNLQHKVNALVELGQHLLLFPDELMQIIRRTEVHNPWFTEENCKKSISAISNEFLNEEKLTNWLTNYDLTITSPKTVGLILAGNIPLVGFHDFMCVWLSGHNVHLKLSSKDDVLFPYVLKLLDHGEEVQIVERLNHVEAVIATGSNNSNRYFEQYFGSKPNILRKNRTSIAVLEGNETDEDILALGNDVFNYFGLGCRNVSKVFVPKGYNIIELLRVWEVFNPLMNHNKFKNNFDYNRSIWLLNGDKHFTNDCLMIKQSETLFSPISSVFYDEYEDLEKVNAFISQHEDKIQCISTNINSFKNKVSLGEAQKPSLCDYADNVDTMEFLVKL